MELVVVGDSALSERPPGSRELLTQPAFSLLRKHTTELTAVKYLIEELASFHFVDSVRFYVVVSDSSGVPVVADTSVAVHLHVFDIEDVIVPVKSELPLAVSFCLVVLCN